MALSTSVNANVCCFRPSTLAVRIKTAAGTVKSHHHPTHENPEGKVEHACGNTQPQPLQQFLLNRQCHQQQKQDDGSQDYAKHNWPVFEYQAFGIVVDDFDGGTF